MVVLCFSVRTGSGVYAGLGYCVEGAGYGMSGCSRNAVKKNSLNRCWQPRKQIRNSSLC